MKYETFFELKVMITLIFRNFYYVVLNELDGQYEITQGVFAYVVIDQFCGSKTAFKKQ